MKNRRQGSDPQCLSLLYLSNERTDIQSTVRLSCTKLKSPTALEMRQLKRLLRYVKGTEDMSTVFEMRDSNDRREQLVKTIGSLHRL